jgi:hypothetical protein
MIGSTRNLRVFAYAQPVDLRKGFDGLYGNRDFGAIARPSLDCWLVAVHASTPLA